MVVVLAATAALTSASIVSAQASSGSDGSADQLVRDPSGQVVRVIPGTGAPETGVPEQQASGKGQPPAAQTAGTTSTNGFGTGCTFRATSQYFCRAGAYQYVTSDGAFMSTPVQSPWVDSADYHSLAELAVETSDGRQIVEIGWRVYRPTDQVPRLFIFHWINGQPTCYNSGCGYVQSTSTTITPGMALTSSTTATQFAIQYFQGNWWLGYNGTWFGYYPGSRWNNTFTKAGLVQMFGEVSSTRTTPCTNMGNGIIGTSASAAQVTGVGYYNTTTATSLTRFNPDDATLYDSQVATASSFRYGGPGRTDC